MRRRPYEFGGQFFGFARSGAVADGDERDVVAVDHVLQGVDRTLPIILRFVRIDRAGVEQFAGGVDHGDFAAGAEARVETEDGLTRQRRLSEQGAQVGGEDLNGMVVGFFAFFAAHIALDGGQQKPFGGILNGKRELIGEGTDDVLLEFGLDGVEPVAFGDIDMHAQDAFLFAASEGKDLVRLESVDAHGEFVITFVDALFHRRHLRSFPRGQLENLSAFSRVTARTLALSLIISATMSRAPCRASSMLVTCSLRNFAASSSGEPQSACFRIKSASGSSPFSRATMARVRRFFLYGAYRSSSAVMVTAALIAFAQFIGQFALLFDGGQDGGAAFVESAQADEFIGDDADLFVVERAGHFLAITGDEWDGVAFV